MLRLGILFFLFLFTIAQASGCVDWPSDVFQPIENSKTHQIAPDYGLYWFKMQDHEEVVAKAYMPPALEPQFSNGQLNQLPPHKTVAQARADRMAWLSTHGFFDSSKPTIIFIHGVQTGETLARHRVDFCYRFPQKDHALSPIYDALPFWKDWNVGVFYWSQFADVKKNSFLGLEAIIDPETRIYNSQASDGMNWVYLNNKDQLSTCKDQDAHCMPMPKNAVGKPYNVSELAFLSYENAIPTGYHQPLRIAGFSFGNQIAILLTKSITEHPQLLQPRQLILLDPYYTPNFLKINIGDKRVAIAAYDKEQVDKILAVNRQLALSFYRSSTVSSGIFGDKNLPLQHEAAYLRVFPMYLNHLRGEEADKLKHLTGLYYYFYSKRFPVQYQDSSSVLFCKSHITANSLITQIKSLTAKTRLCNLNNFAKACEDVRAEGAC